MISLTRNILSLSGQADPIAEIANKMAATINPFFRPKVILTLPAMAPPNIHQIRALDIVNPFTAFIVVSFTSNWVLLNRNIPAKQTSRNPTMIFIAFRGSNIR